MHVELNHTIIHSRDREASAHFLADILGLEVGQPTGRFLPVQTTNGVTLDFATDSERVAPQHYAFLISEEQFDDAFARLEKTGAQYFADPRRSRPGEINHNHGGRGVYFLDPDGHSMEMLTQPYGSG
ncbi:MAG: VOC family protein [Acidimicrobiaceae bacterium]|nr:VOC family protein [Acidimicrobiaceae bacterium]